MTDVGRCCAGEPSEKRVAVARLVDRLRLFFGRLSANDGRSVAASPRSLAVTSEAPRLSDSSAFSFVGSSDISECFGLRAS